MSKPVKMAVAVVSAAVVLACVWSLTRSFRRGGAPKPVLTWQCSKCGEQFDSPLADGGEAAFSETPGAPQRPCPKCSGAAYPVRPFRCTKCGHEFDVWFGPDPRTGKAPELVCPKCGDRRIAPVQALEKK